MSNAASVWSLEPAQTAWAALVDARRWMVHWTTVAVLVWLVLLAVGALDRRRDLRASALAAAGPVKGRTIPMGVSGRTRFELQRTVRMDRLVLGALQALPPPQTVDAVRAWLESTGWSGSPEPVRNTLTGLVATGKVERVELGRGRTAYRIVRDGAQAGCRYILRTRLLEGV